MAVLIVLPGVACAPWRPRLGSSRPEALEFVQRDLEECEPLAYKSGGGSEWLQALDGALLGIFAGGLGAATAFAGDESVRDGAVYGAAIAIPLFAVFEGVRARRQFKRAYRNCMDGRGHEVRGLTIPGKPVK